MKKRVLLNVFSFLLLCTFMSGCSLKLAIQDPALSDIDYVNNGTPQTTIAIVDKRAGNDKIFLMGKLGLGSEMGDISNILSIENIKDPITFFSSNLEKELNQRGLPVKCVVGASEGQDIVLEINRYQILNYRATGFSPWESGHVFDGTIIKDGKKENIKAFFYNGKVPVWSMDEIQEPCFETPSSFLIKDVASKINRKLFNLKSSDEKVAKLSQEIENELSKGANPTEKILELGYTNNANAIPLLKKFSSEGDNFFKSGVLSAMGILGSEDQIAFLQERYSSGVHNEKYMAVKAIGDIGNEESNSLLKKIRSEEFYQKEGGLKSCVDLYISQ